MELTISLILLAGALINALLEGFTLINSIYIALTIVFGALAVGLRFLPKATHKDNDKDIDRGRGKIQRLANPLILLAFLVALGISSKALAPDSPFKLAEEINKSARLLERADYEKAEKLLVALERQNPANERIHLNLAAVYQKARKVEQVRAQLDQAFPRLQHESTIWFNYGMLYYQLGDLKNAQIHFERALQLNPSMTSAAVYAGTMSFRLRELRKSVYYLSHAHFLNPESPEILLHLGRAHFELMNYTASETAYQAALALKPAKGLTTSLQELLAEVEAARGGVNP